MVSGKLDIVDCSYRSTMGKLHGAVMVSGDNNLGCCYIDFGCCSNCAATACCMELDSKGAAGDH
ncbi:hypothetical protein D3C81_1876840 [compost metagenome]